MTTSKNQDQNKYDTKHPNQAKDGQTTMQNQDASRKTGTADQKQDRKDAPQRGKDDNDSR